VLRAIVFDFDGVIANSEPLHFRGYREVLESEGVALIESEYYGRYLGYDDVGAFSAIAADRGIRWDGATIGRLVDRKAVVMERLERDGSIFFPGAEAAIRAAADACPIAIASGALGHEIRRVLDRAGLTKRFSAIVAAEDTPVSKPAPDPYVRAVQLLGESVGAPLGARECVALEDSEWGLQSARAAGLRTVGVAQTYAADALPSAELIIQSMLEFNLETLRQLAGTDT
jgi:beta-phosphoglucomutase-like phosphatase (HAD superfamily)